MNNELVCTKDFIKSLKKLTLIRKYMYLKEILHRVCITLIQNVVFGFVGALEGF